MINTKPSQVVIEAASHPGLSGKKNEDRYRVRSFSVGAQKQTPSVLAVLCDGIGGHRAGEVAAEMGVSIITEALVVSDVHDPLNAMEAAITKASDAIFQASQSQGGRIGMGATCAVAWLIGERLYTANLGDSRIYLLREGHLLQLTTDHTWIQEALDAGVISESVRETHPNAHVIRRYLGSKIPPKPDFRLWYFEDEGDQEALENQGLKIKIGDIVLLCSDGLTDLVSDEEIRAVIKGTDLKKVPDALIDMANRRGGHDNTTVVVMGYPRKPGKEATGARRRRWLLSCLGALVLVSVLVTAVFLGLRTWTGILEARETSQPTVTYTLVIEVRTIQTTSTPTMTITPTLTPVLSSPQPSITPWPTHTTWP